MKFQAAFLQHRVSAPYRQVVGRGGMPHFDHCKQHTGMRQGG